MIQIVTCRALILNKRIKLSDNFPLLNLNCSLLSNSIQSDNRLKIFFPEPFKSTIIFNFRRSSFWAKKLNEIENSKNTLQPTGDPEWPQVTSSDFVTNSFGHFKKIEPDIAYDCVNKLIITFEAKNVIIT